ncbi:hypothetical protein [Paraflavitalea pollutisoli]|uniref:hypothetical protein n=1 Tax=Paraflavitalea pollutisoli TaxID=3034143 RepID=UPI0023EC3C8C|nr:hypothetical protein [Paraflavitalea sp. H1-2-19X]
MQDIEIMNLWRSYDQRLQESLQLNKRNAEEITKLKAQSLLGSMRPMKLFTIIVGVLWVVAVDVVLIGSFGKASWFFTVSMGIQVLLTKIAIGVYLYQLIELRQTDVSEPILATQSRIARLQSSTLWVTRLLFLQTPVWTTFFWSKAMFAHGNVWLLALPVVITLLFAWIAIWLFMNIRFENRDKRWFRFIFRGREWDPMLKAGELLEQVGEYQRL